MQWQVTHKGTTETVNAKRSLDAVSKFCGIHPDANGKHIYAKPLGGNEPAPMRAHVPTITRVTAPPRAEVAATVPPGPSAPVKAPRKVHARGGRAPIVVDMEAEDDNGTTEHVAEIIAAPAQGAQAPKAGGVIGALVALLGDGTKRTKAELYDALATQFPDRASETGGMRSTISVQLNALRGKGHNVVKGVNDRQLDAWWIAK